MKSSWTAAGVAREYGHLIPRAYVLVGYGGRDPHVVFARWSGALAGEPPRMPPDEESYWYSEGHRVVSLDALASSDFHRWLDGLRPVFVDTVADGVAACERAAARADKRRWAARQLLATDPRVTRRRLIGIRRCGRVGDATIATARPDHWDGFGSPPSATLLAPDNDRLKPIIVGDYSQRAILLPSPGGDMCRAAFGSAGGSVTYARCHYSAAINHLSTTTG